MLKFVVILAKTALVVLLYPLKHCYKGVMAFLNFSLGSQINELRGRYLHE